MNKSLHIPAHNRRPPYYVERVATTEKLLSAPEVFSNRIKRLRKGSDAYFVAELDADLSAHDFSAEVRS